MNPPLWSLSGRVPVKLFFAIQPPSRIRPRIETLGTDLKRAHRLGGRVIAAERVHNTLAPVHDERHGLEDIVARARRVAAAIRHSPFRVQFEWTESFVHPGPSHPLVLRGQYGMKSLLGFQQELAVGMRRAGFKVPLSYTPHITMLWGDRPVGDYPILPMQWTVTEFALVLSLVGQSRHIALGRWSLH